MKRDTEAGIRERPATKRFRCGTKTRFLATGSAHLQLWAILSLQLLLATPAHGSAWHLSGPNQAARNAPAGEDGAGLAARNPEHSTSGGEDADLELAYRLQRLGDTEGAISVLWRSIADGRNHESEAPTRRALVGVSIQAGDLRAALRAWREIERLEQIDAEGRLGQALLLMANRELGRASLLLHQVEATATDSTVAHRARFLSGLCALEQKRWLTARDLFRAAFRDSTICVRPEAAQRLDRALTRAASARSYSPATATLLSTVLPGAGQVYAGSYLNGLNALALNALAGTLLVRSARDRKWGEVGLNVAFLFGRFYIGNRYQAGARAEAANAHRSERWRIEATRLARQAAGSDI